MTQGAANEVRPTPFRYRDNAPTSSADDCADIAVRSDQDPGSGREPVTRAKVTAIVDDVTSCANSVDVKMRPRGNDGSGIDFVSEQRPVRTSKEIKVLVERKGPIGVVDLADRYCWAGLHDHQQASGETRKPGTHYALCLESRQTGARSGDHRQGPGHDGRARRGSRTDRQAAACKLEQERPSASGAIHAQVCGRSPGA
jgi:hypothetical protein